MQKFSSSFLHSNFAKQGIKMPILYLIFILMRKNLDKNLGGINLK